MLVFGVTVTKLKTRSPLALSRWSVRVVSTPDEYGRLDDMHAFAADKDEAEKCLTQSLAEACGVGTEEIALSDLTTVYRRRKRSRRV